MRHLLGLVVLVACAGQVAGAQSVGASDLKKHFGIEAEYVASESKLTTTWLFTSARQLGAFTAGPKAPALLDGGGLTLAQGGELVLRELRFAHPQSVTLQVRLENAKSMFNIGLEVASAGCDGALCFFRVPIEDEDGETEICDGVCEVKGGKLLPAAAVAATAITPDKWVEIRIATTESKVKVWVDGWLIRGDDLAPPKEYRVSFAANGGEVQIRNLRTHGRISPDSLRKLVRSEQARDRAPAGDEAEGLRVRLMLIAEEQLEMGNRILADLRAGRFQRRTRKPVVPNLRELRRLNQAVGAWNAERYDDAVRSLRVLAKSRQDETSYSFLIGQIQTHAGKLEEALRTYEGVVARDPKFAEAWRAIGLLHLQLGDEFRAEAPLNRARSLARSDAWNIAFQGLLYLQWGDFPKARTKLQLAREARPKSESIKLLERHLKMLTRPPWIGRRHYLKSARYVIESNVGEDFVARVGKLLDRYRAFLEAAFPLSRKSRKRSRVWIFDTEESYLALTATLARRMEHSAGCFHSGLNTLLLYAALDPQHNEQVLYHEAFHQYLRTAVNRTPLWLEEGLAEYYGSTRFDKSGSPVAGGMIRMRVETLRAYFAENQLPLSFRHLMQLNPLRFMEEKGVEIRYAQSWSMVHFFRHGADPSTRRLFDAYVQAVLANKGADAAFAATFGKPGAPDLSKIQAAWQSYVGSKILQEE